MERQIVELKRALNLPERMIKRIIFGSLRSLSCNTCFAFDRLLKILIQGCNLVGWVCIFFTSVGEAKVLNWTSEFNIHMREGFDSIAFYKITWYKTED